MAIQIVDGWDVSHHHIHEGFKHLGHSINANLGVSKKYQNIKKSKHWAEYLSLSMQVKMAFIDENKEAIKSIILFQAGMEAWISWAYTKPELSAIQLPRTFKDKWEKAFSEVGIVYDFSNYHSFYKSVRNAIIHPSQKADIKTVSQVNAKIAYDGIKHGWETISELSNGLGQKFDSNSFETMCTANGVQYDEIIHLGDLKAFESELLKEHLDETRKNSK